MIDTETKERNMTNLVLNPRPLWWPFPHNKCGWCHADPPNTVASSTILRQTLTIIIRALEMVNACGPPKNQTNKSLVLFRSSSINTLFLVYILLYVGWLIYDDMLKL